MADIPDAQADINDVEVSTEAALSEAFFTKVGGAINYLNTTTDANTSAIGALESFQSDIESPYSASVTWNDVDYTGSGESQLVHTFSSVQGSRSQYLLGSIGIKAGETGNNEWVTFYGGSFGLDVDVMQISGRVKIILDGTRIHQKNILIMPKDNEPGPATFFRQFQNVETWSFIIDLGDLNSHTITVEADPGASTEDGDPFNNVTMNGTMFLRELV